MRDSPYRVRRHQHSEEHVLKSHYLVRHKVEYLRLIKSFARHLAGSPLERVKYKKVDTLVIWPRVPTFFSVLIIF